MDREQVRVVLGEAIRASAFRRTDGSLAEVWIYPANRLFQDQLNGHGSTLFRLVLVDGVLAVVEPLS